SVFVIDCTVIGASPPTLTRRRAICRVRRRVIIPSVLLEEFEDVEATQVVVEREYHDHHQQHEAHLLRYLALAQRQRAAQDRLDDEEQQVAAVQHGDRQQVQHAQVHADDGDEQRDRQETLVGLPRGLGGNLDRPSDARQVHLRRGYLPQPCGREHGHVPGPDQAVPRRGLWSVRLEAFGLDAEPGLDLPDG